MPPIETYIFKISLNPSILRYNDDFNISSIFILFIKNYCYIAFYLIKKIF